MSSCILNEQIFLDAKRYFKSLNTVRGWQHTFTIYTHHFRVLPLSTSVDLSLGQYCHLPSARHLRRNRQQWAYMPDISQITHLIAEMSVIQKMSLICDRSQLVVFDWYRNMIPPQFALKILVSRIQFYLFIHFMSVWGGVDGVVWDVLKTTRSFVVVPYSLYMASCSK